MSGLQQDLVVEALPLGLVSQNHRELTQTGQQVLGHPLLVQLLSPQTVLQLWTQTGGRFFRTARTKMVMVMMTTGAEPSPGPPAASTGLQLALCSGNAAYRTGRSWTDSRGRAEAAETSSLRSHQRAHLKHTNQHY